MTDSTVEPTRFPIPVEKGLQIEYAPNTDILTLWTGTPASNGATVAEGLTVFFDEDDEPQMVTLENAADLLSLYLCARGV